MNGADDESDSSQEEGFFKPPTTIQQLIRPSSTALRVNQCEDTANQLTSHERPTDYLPRVLVSSSDFHETQAYIDTRKSICRAQLYDLRTEKIRNCKYYSLRQKYVNNALYELAYSRMGPNVDFNTYVFNLEGTTDYNPRYFKTATTMPTGSFDSCFEGGNLSHAYRHTTPLEQYDLIMQNDTNTKGYNQWFYLSFTNTTPGKVKFNVVNFIKKRIMFQEGVRPIGFLALEPEKGWHSIGEDISYQKSYVSREVQNQGIVALKNYYTLSFTVTFLKPNSKIYMALNYPYTYSMMIKSMDRLMESAPSEIVIEKQILCYSVANNAVPCLRIKHIQGTRRKRILIIARQHPGESVGSYVLQGFLFRAIKQIKFLRSYELVVVPMVNVDGVIYGNFRTNLAGFDLNRQWVDPNKWLHPEVFYLQKLISSLQNIVFVLDCHGHSKKWNSFIYSCVSQRPSQFRLYPYIYSKVCPLFSVKDCTFNITQAKIRTARVNIFKEINIPQVYTLETSFFGYSNEQGKFRYQISDFEAIGNGAFESMKLFLTDKVQVRMFEREMKEKEFMFDQWALQNNQDIGSQSNPSEDQFNPHQRKEKVMSEKKSSMSNMPKRKKGKKRQESIQIFDRLSMVEQSKKEEEKKEEKKQEKKEEKKEEKKNLSSAQQIRVRKEKEKSITSRKRTEIQKSKLLMLKQPKIKALNKIPQAKERVQVVRKLRNYSQSQVKEKDSRGEKRSVSNLFNTSNFYSQMQTKIQQTRLQHQVQSLADKTHSLQINNVQNMKSLVNQNATSILKKLIPIQAEENPMRLKRKEKIYIIKDNKIMSSINKISQDEMKRNLEEEIHHRTAALRNCQKKMREMSLECEPLLLSSKGEWGQLQMKQIKPSKLAN